MARAEIKVVATVDLDQIAGTLDRHLKAASDVVSFIDTSRPGGQEARDVLVASTKALNAAAGEAVRVVVDAPGGDE